LSPVRVAIWVSRLDIGFQVREGGERVGPQGGPAFKGLFPSSVRLLAEV